MTIILTGVFTARYAGWCNLEHCEKNSGRIQQGDACQHVDDLLYHLGCARRVERGQTDPLCEDCYCYHVGQCA